MEKPDKKSYPDYYDIITEPIDMNCIDSKINRNVYRSVCTAVDRVDFFFCYSVQRDMNIIDTHSSYGQCSVADPDAFDTDPDPAFQSDPDRLFDTDPDPCRFKEVPVMYLKQYGTFYT
jgi:hypothetical protein